eukprot:GFUD01058163.1.p1 GENE.GFUD01058163.1~~GFUD01058163.1.p1  ORF type:complete len:216 (-),score=40.55 GFUD01058163.1:19-666(-)
MKEDGLKEQFTPYYRTESEFQLEDDKRASTCLSLSSLGALLVSLVMIVMGALHAAPADAGKDPAGVLKQNCSMLEYCGCPGEPMIPWYLILGGCLTLLLVVARILLLRFCTSCPVGGCRLSCITLYDILALVMTTMWLIAGTKFVMALHERKNYSTHNPNQDTCDWGLYWFAFVLIICGWIFIFFATFCGLMCRFCKCFWNILNCRTCREDKHGY